ncbi:MAG: type IV toxin-antitoxin system AbiEi family antitoxin [Bacteroidota bacterium]
MESLEDWVYHSIGKGRHAFSFEEVRALYSDLPDEVLKVYLNRLAKKQRILSLHRGYYLIVLPQYQSMGILPVSLFIDGLMKYLNRPYYVGLLSAAALHGAAHQQPQEFFVVTTKPSMRPIRKKGIQVNFVSKAEIPNMFLEEKKTQTGYLKVSSPILTAIDLLDFADQVGFLNRVCTVLDELAETIKPSDFNRKLLKICNTSTLQRLGYIFEHIIDEKNLADAVYNLLSKTSLPLYRVKLDSKGKIRACPLDKKWNIYINAQIETD